MPKLSALTPGNIVKIPIFGVVQAFVFLQYNHYGKSEAVLLGAEFTLPEGDVYGHETSSVTAGVGIYIKDKAYSMSSANMFCSSTLKNGLADAVKGSLVNNRFKADEDYITTSIIVPTAAEVGQSSVPIYPSSSSHKIGQSSYSDGGTAFNYLQNIENMNFRDRVDVNVSAYSRIPKIDLSGYSGKRRTENVYLSDSEDSALNTVYLTFFNSWLGGTTSGGVRIRGISGRPTAQPIFLFNGNMEVTGTSTNYTISKASAIETYRKIDGVWYRTV